MTVPFKFAVGDFVIHKVALCDILSNFAITGRWSVPKTMVICERYRQECPGGEQLHYKGTMDNCDNKANFLEHELLDFIEAMTLFHDWRIMAESDAGFDVLEQARLLIAGLGPKKEVA